MKQYLLNIILGVDQLANCIIGGAPDETISARCWRHKNQFGWKQLRWLLDNVLLRWDRDAGKTHCEMAFLNELNDVHKPSIYR